jgi:hypothetical protein
MADCVIVCLCPIDGLGMTVNISLDNIGNAQGTPPHTHVIVDNQITCLNVVTAHVWKVTGTLTIERVS